MADIELVSAEAELNEIDKQEENITTTPPKMIDPMMKSWGGLWRLIRMFIIYVLTITTFWRDNIIIAFSGAVEGGKIKPFGGLLMAISFILLFVVSEMLIFQGFM